MRISLQGTAILVLLVLASFTCCKKTDDGIKYELLIGKWQYYEGSIDDEPLILGHSGELTFTIQFYGIDSVNYMDRRGTYFVDESTEEITMQFDDFTRIAEILKLNYDLLWIKQIINDRNVELHFNRIN